jgi:hypothetical protein
MLALFTIFIQSQVLAAAHDGFTSVGTAFPFSTALLKNGVCPSHRHDGGSNMPFSAFSKLSTGTDL